MFNQQQRNRYGITLDLAMEKGKEVYKKLAKISDILVENFSARVMINLGLGYSVLSQINPGLIMISMSGFGMTGPESGYRSYGSTLEQLTGIAMTMGYPDGLPMQTGIFYPDPTAGTLAAGAVIAALHQRRRTGKGIFIEMSQREATLRLLGDGLMEYQMNKRTPPRLGNRDRAMAPHGCYRCQGEDSWIAIAVRNDEEWKALCQVMGKPELADDERFADVLSRHQNHDELDSIIEEWTKGHDHNAAMHLLQKAGVPAGALLNAREVLYDPQLNDRGYFEKITHPEAGDLTLVGMAWKLSKSPGSIRKPAPCLGEHNHYVLGELLGMSEEGIEELEKERVI
ncbi:MAG: CoA transferase, partial [Chloroflexota bacterium]|nr:CoA transferase [Chloroflexota bacterium]